MDFTKNCQDAGCDARTLLTLIMNKMSESINTDNEESIKIIIKFKLV